MSKGYEHKSEFKRNWMITAGAAYYMFATQAAQRQAEKFYADPDALVARKVWDLLDSKFLSRIYESNL